MQVVRWPQGSGAGGLTGPTPILPYRSCVTCPLLQHSSAAGHSSAPHWRCPAVNVHLQQGSGDLSGAAPKGWSSAPREIILSTEAPGWGRWSCRVRAGVCLTWFKTVWDKIRVWNNPEKAKKWFCWNDTSSLIKLACCVRSGRRICAQCKHFYLIDRGLSSTQGVTWCCCRMLVAKILVLSLPPSFSI